MSSANQGATASCKASTGISSVDGSGIIGPPSMMSTVGLELVNYINPDLTWKKVAKGYRSSSRRTRKHVLRNFAVGEELAQTESRKVDEGTASDAEKHGVAILGRRFSDKIENIPLKKRLLLRCNSLPPRSFFEAPLNGKRQVRATGDGTRCGPEKKSAKVKETAFDLSEDLSGMEILADVASSNNMIGDVDLDMKRSLLEDSKIDGTGLCDSEAPVVKNVSSPKDTACEEIDKESSLLGNSEATLQRPPITIEIEAVEGSASACDVRLHWDLNVPEDAWGKPCDASTFYSHGNASVCLSTETAGRVEVVKNSEVKVESKDIPDSFVELVSQDAKEQLPLCRREGSSGLNGFEALGRVEVVKNSEVKVEAEDIPDSFAKLVSQDANENLPFCRHEGSSGLNRFESCGQLDENSKGQIPISAANKNLVYEVADVKWSSKISGVISSRGDLDIARVSEKDGSSTSPVSLEEKPAHESDACFIEDGQDTGAGIAVSNEKSVHCVTNLKICQDAKLVSCAVKVEASAVHPEVDSPSHERSEDMMQKSSEDSTSTPKDVSGIQDNGPTSSLANMTAGDPSDSYGSDVYQTEKVGAGSNNELQAGYDSQFEDGELRESYDRYYWDENEGEVGEVEHVDYGSDYGDEERLGSIHEKEVEFERGGSTPGSYDRKVDCSGKADVTRDDSVSPKSRVLDVPLEKGLASALAATRTLQGEFGDEERLGSMHEKEMEFEKGSTPSSYDRKVDRSGKADVTPGDSLSPNSRVLDVPLEKGLASCLAATRTLPGEFASCAEGPDARKNPYSRSRSENCRNVYPRDERDNTGGPRRYMGRERVDMHIRGRSPGRCLGNPSTSYWNFERCYSPTRPSYMPGRPRPKNNNEDRRYMMSSDRNMDSVGGGYFENRPNRQFANSPPNGVYARIMRRSPSNRDDSYMNMRMLPMRDTSPSNRGDSYMNTRMMPMRDTSSTRGRFRRFTPGGGRGGGIRDEFRRPLPEDSAEYPNRMGHRLLKRDRSSTSPLPRRPHMAMPYRRSSRSRSRSRSPPIYMQKRREQQRNKGGGGSVLRSRSPDGMRARLPFQKRFPAKYEDRFTSPTRPHFSNRCGGAMSFDDNRGMDGFRGRKSPPVRMYRPQQQGNNRFESLRSFRIDDEFRQARKFRDGVDGSREYDRADMTGERGIRDLRCLGGVDANREHDGSDDMIGAREIGDLRCLGGVDANIEYDGSDMIGARGIRDLRCLGRGGTIRRNPADQ